MPVSVQKPALCHVPQFRNVLRKELFSSSFLPLPAAEVRPGEERRGPPGGAQTRAGPHGQAGPLPLRDEPVRSRALRSPNNSGLFPFPLRQRQINEMTHGSLLSEGTIAACVNHHSLNYAGE